MPYSEAFKAAYPDLIKSRRALANAKYNAAHPEKMRAAKRSWYERNREKELARLARRKVTKAPQDAASHLMRKYGITPAEYDVMLEAQGGVCAICHGPPNGRWKNKFHVDHDHKTKKVRGLLCFRCNTMIGAALELASILEAAAAYLRTHVDPHN